MKKFFGTVLAVFVSLVLFFVLMPVLLLPTLMSSSEKPDLPGHMVLELDLRQSFSDQPQDNPLNILGETQPAIVKVVEALARAESDKRVSGVFVRLGGESDLPLAQAEEVRDSFKSLRRSGKFVIVHAQSFQSKGLGSYYAASESDELWLQPNGSLATKGTEVSSVFMRDLLSIISSVPGSKTAGDFSRTANTYMEVDFTGRESEAYDSLAGSIVGRAAEGIAASRSMTADQVNALLSASPYLASEALAAGLVNQLGYDDEAAKVALDKAGKGATLVSWSDYLEGAGSPFGEGEVIAVVYGEGPIDLGAAGPGQYQIIGGDTTAKAIRDAADDKMVKAILFRVESPGGSAVAADQIWDAVNYAKDKGKPVVVSMGSVAASGGYYVAMAADRIIAQPTTITGSIGVVGGKFALAGNYGMLGLKVAEGDGGDKAIQNENDAEQWLAVNKMLISIYTDFTSKVAQGRGMSVEEVHKIAGGRMWSGVQAREIGLIDELGGFRFALGETKEMIGLDANAAVELRTFPGPRTRRERYEDMIGISTGTLKVLYELSAIGQVETVKDLAESVYTDGAPEESSRD